MRILLILLLFVPLVDSFLHKNGMDWSHRAQRSISVLSATKAKALESLVKERAPQGVTASVQQLSTQSQDPKSPMELVHAGIPLITSAIGVGTVTASPTLAHTKSGLSVCNVRLACKNSISSEFPGVQDRPNDLITVTAEFWGKDAEHISNSVDVGTRMAISGSFYVSRWADKGSGTERSAMKIRCKFFEIISQPTKTKSSKNKAKLDYSGTEE